MQKVFELFLLFVMLTFFGGPAAYAGTNLLFILDASNSMWGQVDGTSKIDTAKSTLTDLLTTVEDTTNVGLMVYGNRQKDDCTDVELVLPLGKANPSSIAATMENVVPKGKTPMALSIAESADAFKGCVGENNNVVLISDGIETCDGDPCAAAGALAAANIGVRVHVVGFDISDKDRAQLECIAEKGGGRYLPASSSQGLVDAVAEVTQVAQAAPEAAPAAPEWQTVFEDDFNGSELGKNWTVVNPNADAYIVENGELLLLANKAGWLDDDNVQNLMVLDQKLPDGDWRMTAKLHLEIGTEVQIPFLGLYKDKDNYLIADFGIRNTFNNDRALHLFAVKKSGSDLKEFNLQIPGQADNVAELNKMLPPVIYLQIEKAGRSYVARARMGDDENAKWIETSKLTSLRSPGGPVLGITQTRQDNGESLVNVDWLKIEAVTPAD